MRNSERKGKRNEIGKEKRVHNLNGKNLKENERNKISETCYSSLLSLSYQYLFYLIDISETRDAMPTKIGVHALNINPYLHEFFEPIPID